MGEHASRSASQFAAGSANVGLQGFIVIVQRQIERSGMTLRHLHRKGVISERTRKRFETKLSSGQLSISEVERISGYVGINFPRAAVAVFMLRDPMAYFEPDVEVVAQVAEEASIAMREQIAATSCDFGPIKRSLVQAHSVKLTKQLIEGQERARKRNEEALQADLERLMAQTSLQ